MDIFDDNHFESEESPFEIFRLWLEKAQESEAVNFNAMALSTVDSEGYPDVRMVLLKNFDENGFVFFTNLESAKARQIKSCKKAALCFYWKSLGRQIRIRGNTTIVSDEEANSYFDSRPRKSRIGAWASRQSQALETPCAFKKSIAKYSLKFLTGDIPRPPHWSGFRVNPFSIEFWQEEMFRLHQRFLFNKKENKWDKIQLYP